MVVLDAESSEGDPEADTAGASPAAPSTPQPSSCTQPQAAVEQELETLEDAETRVEGEEEEEEEDEEDKNHTEDAPEAATGNDRPASSRLSTGMQVRCGIKCTSQYSSSHL